MTPGTDFADGQFLMSTPDVLVRDRSGNWEQKDLKTATCVSQTNLIAPQQLRGTNQVQHASLIMHQMDWRCSFWLDWTE